MATVLYRSDYVLLKPIQNAFPNAMRLPAYPSCLKTKIPYIHLSPVPSLAFFHIALPEFNQAASDENAQLYGIRREKACAPALNSGLFTAIKENGDVMGVFVGHDHDDDYAVCWYDVLLAYGRFTGGPTEYIHIPNGARVIELNEGARTFKTWIRTKAGVEQLTTYPDSFVKE